jgi:long-chain fatty acid transport protein
MRNRLFSLMTFIIVTFLVQTNSYSQDLGLIDEASAGNFFGLGARSMGMGGTGIALSNDATALIYNPANLARIRRIELNLGLSHQRWRSETGPLSSAIMMNNYLNENQTQANTRFSTAALVLPVPTYRGSLVFALGVNRVKSFDKAFSFSYGTNPNLPLREGMEAESGGLYVWSAGGAIDISPHISLGGALNYWTGKETYTWKSINRTKADTMITYDDEIIDDYSGFSAKFGISMQPNKYLTLAGTIETPIWYTITEDFTLISDTSSSPYIWTDVGATEYKLTEPYSFGLGIGLNLKSLTLASDFSFTDWSQMEYRDAVDKAEKNRKIKEAYQEVIRWHVGAEYLIPKIEMKVRAGYYQNPLPWSASYLVRPAEDPSDNDRVQISKDKDYFALGFGFLIEQTMTIDLAWNYGSYKLKHLDLGYTEKQANNTIFITTAYHF